MASSLTNSFFARVTSIDKAAEVAKKPPPKIVELTAEAKLLPQHILNVTEPAKLNAQTPFFRCPPWADLPAFSCHLHCTRDGKTQPSLGLHRFPFYLFGQSSVCDYVLAHPSVSNIHAVLVFHGEKKCFVLMDLGSTNGVRLNGVRIERQRPVPAPVGSKIQFGFSTRQYELRLGAQPSSEKRAQEARDDTSSSMAKRARVETSATDTKDSTNSPLPDVKPIIEESREPIPPVPCEDKNNETVPLTDVAKTVEQHLYHILIKHKDVRKPVSLAPRNKGDKITRSKADAFLIAQSILSHHNEKGPWSVGAFTAIVRDYSECGSAKRDGDLGMVERGSYTEDFDKAAFALSIGEVSAPVETELGIHLIYRAG